ncbi:MAG: hypothetical protein JSR70_08575 [Proteobacteria bacterium]|nr:hypothetical protein [Pseudomonadota bacterium]
MSAVDVLAVMDAEIASLPEMAALAGIRGVSCDAIEAVARLTEARAAVAELIEMSQLRVEWINGSWYVLSKDGGALSNRPQRTEEEARTEAEEALRDALARVRGEA